MEQTRSFVDPSATLGAGVALGHGVFVGARVVMGEHCELGAGVVVHADCRLGPGVRVGDHAVLGKLPMRSSLSAVTTDTGLDPLVVETGCLIGTGAVVYRGARLGPGVLVADLATVRERVGIGERSIVGCRVSIENDCTIGGHVKLETGCYISAYSRIGNRVFVAPMVTTTNDRFVGRTEERLRQFKGITIERGGRVGAGAVLLPGLLIGEDALVAAGSVVTRDVPARQVVMGTPARVVGAVPEEQLLDNQSWDDVRSGRS